MLAAGSRIGLYEIVAKLGEGGMGEVYRARDTSLNRDVAIKVLPANAIGDGDRLARFTREAQTLAALNHPNIAQIYGFEAQAKALVMELVEGRDLSAVIAAGPVPPAEAAVFARQIAEALEAAHEQGIIHRDLKPANVKVRADGTVKVLDFGLAKALASDGAGATADAMNSPTLTNRATQLGMILGTAAYMSPEQAKGKAVDRRADIWAFGVVLYEMLSGRRAFEGEDVSTTMAAVLMKDPDWSALPASTPAPLRRLIGRCLERDPRLRLRDIGEARILLSSPMETAAGAPEAGSSVAARSSRRSLVPWVVTAGALAVAGAALAFNALGSREPSADPVQFTVAYPPNVRPLSNGSDYDGGVISPNGRLIAFSATDANTGSIAIYVRHIDSIEARLVKNTDGGRYPFWAPSSNTIAFYAKGKLNRVDLDGGSPIVICDAPTGGWGGSWNSDDVIVAGIRDPGPIVRVSAKGGDTPRPVTALIRNDLDHDWPQFLPDGRHFVYTGWGSIISARTAFYVGSIDGSEPKLVREDIDQNHSMSYAHPGFMLFIRDGSLMAQRLDTTRFELQGDPVAIAANASGPIVASLTGAVTYVTTQMATVRNRFVTINADGTNEQRLMDPAFYNDPSLSPDGLRLAYAKRESSSGAHDVWIREMATGVERRLTFDAADDRSPVWSPTGDEIIFSSMREPVGLYRKKANGAGKEELVTGKDFPQSWAYQWHRNGFVTAHSDLGHSYDVRQVTLKDSRTTPLLDTPGLNELRGAVSPDGRWLAYDSRETARFEVFLTTYPPSATRLPVSTDGGAEARWSHDGRLLFYVSSATGALMVADVTPGDPPTFGAHRSLHPGPLDWGWTSARSFDVDPRSGRLVLEILADPGDLTVLMNWQGKVKR